MEITKMKKRKNCNKLTNLESIWQNALFLDIETTGFSPEKSRLYLIGVSYIQQTSESTSQSASEPTQMLVTEQFFAESFEDEPLLLQEFETLASHFQTIITFHGNQFDIPFLAGCCKRLGFVWDTESKSENTLVDNNKNYVDLYKLAYRYRNVFRLENYKQKTIEKFLGIDRMDCDTGGDLVKVYRNYLKHPEDALFERLMQHNYEDITGMIRLLKLYAYENFFQGKFCILECQCSSYHQLDAGCAKELLILCQLSHVLPAPITCCWREFYMHADGERAVFRIPFLEDTLKYFYQNYKDYYYLPEEDVAIHKSVAAYVDSAHREKAKPSNCYNKKTGVYLPQYEGMVIPAFYTEYKAPKSYFEWTDALAENKTLMKQYCMHILHIIKAGK